MITEAIKIPISNISLSDLEQRYVNDCLSSGIISSASPYVHRFEEAFAHKIGRRHGIACANGTLALEVALMALELLAGSEVIVPAYTFAAPAAAVKRVGLQPVFADVSDGFWEIDADRVREQITDKTSAIIAVDLIGHPVRFRKLDFDFPMIEDAAEAHGVRYHSEYCGSFGAISTFSFYGNKAITSGEGGIILTDSDVLAKRIRSYLAHGLVPGQGYTHDRIGTNARMIGLAAAVALAQTERFDELTSARQRICRRYRQKIKPEWGYGFRPIAPYADESCWLFALTHPERDRIITSLRQAGVEARAAFVALPDLPIYADACRGDYPVAWRLGREVFFLPTSAVMTDAEVDYVVECLELAL